MNRLLKIVLVLLVLAGLGFAGYRLYQGRTAAAQQAATATGSFTQVVEAQRGDLSSSLSVVGELASQKTADLKFEKLSNKAPLLTLAVAAGNMVKQGQVLATVDPASYQQAVDQAKSDLQATEKKLADLKTPATDLQTAQADLAIAKAQYQIEQAKGALDDLLHPDLDKLRSNVADAQNALTQAQADVLAQQDEKKYTDQLAKLQDAESKATVEHGRLASESYSDSYYQDRLAVAYNKMMDAKDARVTYEVQQQVNKLKAQEQVTRAQQSLKKAQQALADAQKGGDTLERAKAELAVKDAEVSFTSAQDARAQLSAGADATELAATQADVDKKKLAVADAEAALAGTQLVAPFDGTVLETAADAGTTIGATTPILTLADLGQLEVLASVDETTIRRVSQGQAAEVTFDALAGQTLAGMVGEVPLQGTLQGGVMVYEVPITLTGAEQLPLLVGMTANVKIATGQAQNALLVPAMALQKVNGLYQVTVQTGAGETATTETVPVEVGLSDGTYTQIVRGLNEGDKIVVTIANTQNNSNFRGFGGLGGFGEQRVRVQGTQRN